MECAKRPGPWERRSKVKETFEEGLVGRGTQRGWDGGVTEAEGAASTNALTTAAAQMFLRNCMKLMWTAFLTFRAYCGVLMVC